MNELALKDAGELSEAREITGTLFDDFVKWVDRCPATTKTYIINLRQFYKYLLLNGINKPTRDDIISYRDGLTAAGYKASTIAGYLRAVKMFFAWTAENGLYPNVAAGVRVPKVDTSTHKKDNLTVEQWQTVEESIEATTAGKIERAAESEKDTAGRVNRATEQALRLRAMYELVSNAGLRTIEVSRANVGDYEKIGNQAYIYIYGKGCTEASQKKPIAADVAAILDEYLACRHDRLTPTAPLFVSTGNRSGGKRIASTTVSKMLKQAMREAGFDSSRLTAHSIRHSTATMIAETGNSLQLTQKYMRHADPKTTEIYMHNDLNKAEAEAAERLYSYMHTKRTA